MFQTIKALKKFDCNLCMLRSMPRSILRLTPDFETLANPWHHFFFFPPLKIEISGHVPGLFLKIASSDLELQFQLEISLEELQSGSREFLGYAPKFRFSKGGRKKKWCQGFESSRNVATPIRKLQFEAFSSQSSIESEASVIFSPRQRGALSIIVESGSSAAQTTC